MSAVDVASGMREPVVHFDQLALLDRAAIGDAPEGASIVALAVSARERSQELVAARPPREPRRTTPRGWREWLGLAEVHGEPTALDAWDSEVGRHEQEVELAMERAQEAADAAWMSAATADKDAAVDDLVARGLLAPALADQFAREQVGQLLVLAALSHD